MSEILADPSVSENLPMDRLEARLRQYSGRPTSFGEPPISKTVADAPAVSESPRLDTSKAGGASMTEQERERFTVVFNASRGVYELCQHHREEMVRDVAAVLRSVVDQIRTLDETLKGKGMSMTEPERERFAVVSNALRGVYELCQHHREEMVRDVAAVLRSVVDQTRTLDEMLAARR